MNCWVLMLNVVSAVGTLLAAFFWFRSATVSLPAEDRPDENGMIQGSVSINGVDVSRTFIAQGKLGKKGAMAAALAALAQGLAIVIDVAAKLI